MRASLFLLVFAVFTACSTVENVEQNTTSNLEVNTADVANFNIQSSARSSQYDIWDDQGNRDYFDDNRIVVNYHDGGNWRTNYGHNGRLFNKLSSNPDGFTTLYYTDNNGTNYWFNFILDRNSKYVKYAIATDSHVLQQGETTIRLWIGAGQYSGTIRFDVELGKYHLPKQVFVNMEYDNGKYFATVKDEINIDPYTFVTPMYPWRSRAANLQKRDHSNGTDWRGFWAREDHLFDWLIKPYQHRHFHYHTEPDGEEFWFNYTFFDHRSDVWYQITSSKKGPIQSGYSTVRLTSLLTGSTGLSKWGGLIQFDVKFDARTHLDRQPNMLFTKGFNANFAHRGFVSSNTYLPNPLPWQFIVHGGHKNF